MKTNSICFITTAHPMYGIGGAEIQTWYYAKEFSNQGWEVTFLTKKKKNIIHRFDDTGITVAIIPNNKINILKILSTLVKMWKVNCKYYFIRHHNYVLGIAAYLCKIRARKLIWSTMHDQSCGRNPEFINLDKSAKKKIKWKINNILFNYGVKNSHLIIVQNHLQSQIVKTEHDKNSIIMYNSRPYSETYNFGNKKNRVLFIATIKEFKQPELFCQIARSFRGDKYEFIIIGENYQDKEKAANLVKLMKSSGCTYLGFLPPDEVNKFINSSKLLVNTSSSEGFPNTFVQAWLNGVPVVSLNVDPDNLIKKNQLGYCCKGDLDMMKNKINYIMDNDKHWTRISKNCKKFAADSLNLTSNVKKMSEVFLSLK